jgi:hypothetical protein
MGAYGDLPTLIGYGCSVDVISLISSTILRVGVGVDFDRSPPIWASTTFESQESTVLRFAASELARFGSPPIWLPAIQYPIAVEAALLLSESPCPFRSL